MRRFALCAVLVACGPDSPTNEDTGTVGDTGTDPTTSSSPTSTNSGESTTTTTSGDPATSEPGTETSTTADSDDPLTTTTTTSTSTSSEGSSTSDETGEAFPCCVAPDEPSAAVEAKTPLGDLTLAWASFGISSGECGGDWFLHLYPDAAQVGTEGPDELRITAQTAASEMMWPDGFIGTGPVTIEARVGAEFLSVEAEITVVEVDADGIFDVFCNFEGPPIDTDLHVQFTIAAELDGWSVQGEARAEYCPTLDLVCP